MHQEGTLHAMVAASPGHSTEGVGGQRFPISSNSETPLLLIRLQPVFNLGTKLKDVIKVRLKDEADAVGTGKLYHSWIKRGLLLDFTWPVGKYF